MLRTVFCDLNKNHQLKQLCVDDIEGVLTSILSASINIENQRVLLCHTETCSYGNKIHIAITTLFNTSKTHNPNLVTQPLGYVQQLG